MNAEQKPKTFGVIGVIAAFLGLLAVLVGPPVHDAIYPKPRLSATIEAIYSFSSMCFNKGA